ncbi:HD-GYP domain-containing protein [Cellulosilyticum sp. I15G10I2]|uniref:HD-GYP domain-containing protein n=1 Tax=Cellulosilyticum sp. I15G10I2 TaxID=1892843 RepID=UPI00085C4CAB|nr:HD domain-containing phosphohydrolase [Cellulosilyticum sp. I15G10I2]
MQSITLKHILKIIQNSFNTLDTRLSGHGNQAAYILWKILESKGGYSQKQMLEFCALAVFHDIGAYKTEELNEILKFEVISPHSHSIYGSLFIKYFSPLADKSDIILYHHLDYINKDKVSSNHLDEALLLHLADRITIMLKKSGLIDYTSLYQLADVKFSKEDILLFARADKEHAISKKILNDTYADELYTFFESQILTHEELLAYSRMFAYSIDFRSEHTVYHTIMVTELSRLLCLKLGVDETTTRNVAFGALMHDIGKFSTPVSILEKPGKLTYEEMKIMKNHVVVTFEILKDLGFKEIIDIASYHHEKLDGTGYPFGLQGDELSFPARIVMITDIFSALLGKRSYKEPFPKERIISILNDLAYRGKIDDYIIEVVVSNYDELVEELHLSCQNTFEQYKNIKKEYTSITAYFDKSYDHISC